MFQGTYVLIKLKMTIRATHEPQNTQRAEARLLVCAGCHAEVKPWPALAQRTGYDLVRLLRRELKRLGLPVRVQGVRCLGVCDADQCCAAALDAPGKDTVVLGKLAPADAVEVVSAFVRLHLADRRGRVLGRFLPAGFVRHFMLRIPGNRSQLDSLD